MQAFGVLVALIVGLELFEKYDNDSVDSEAPEVVESTE